jgi:hypothetical protein
MSRRPALIAAAAAGLVVTAGAPALAVTATCTGSPATCVAGVPVSVVGLGGTRQFTVEDVTGADLTSLDLGTGGAQPFRTHIADAGFTATGQSYSVSATMTNLYLRQGNGHDYAVKVPSSAASLGFGSSPLAGSGISLVDLPKLSVTGTLGSSCLNLSSALKSALGINSITGLPLDATNTLLSGFCTTLLTDQSVAATVDGALQTVSPVVSSLTDLPTPLSGALGGTFTNPSFASGTVGANDPAATGTTPTSVPIMTGGALNLTAGLSSALTSALNSALSGLPLVNATDTGTRTTLAAAVAALSSSSDAITSKLGAVLNTLSAANQVTVLTSLASSLVAPVLGDVASLNGNYYGFPILQATPSTPVAGTYDGTLTVTFVQS